MNEAARSSVLAAMAAIVFLLTGCAQTVSEISADYPAYSSVEELVAASDVIAEVEIGTSHHELLLPRYEGDDPELNPHAGSKEQPSDPRDGAVPVTVHEAVVRTVYAGSTQPGTTLQIKQLGGETDEGKVVVPGVRSLVSGETVLVFLEDFPDDPSSILGGDAGLFVREDDGTYRSASDSGLTVTSAELEELAG